MEPKDILWEAYKILRDVCEEDGQCPNCILYESCKDLPRMPHGIIKAFHYDLYTKPLLDREENENVLKQANIIVQSALSVDKS